MLFLSKLAGSFSQKLGVILPLITVGIAAVAAAGRAASPLVCQALLSQPYFTAHGLMRPWAKDRATIPQMGGRTKSRLCSEHTPSPTKEQPPSEPPPPTRGLGDSHRMYCKTDEMMNKWSGHGQAKDKETIDTRYKCATLLLIILT